MNGMQEEFRLCFNAGANNPTLNTEKTTLNRPRSKFLACWKSDTHDVIWVSRPVRALGWPRLCPGALRGDVKRQASQTANSLSVPPTTQGAPTQDTIDQEGPWLGACSHRPLALGRQPRVHSSHLSPTQITNECLGGPLTHRVRYITKVLSRGEAGQLKI